MPFNKEALLMESNSPYSLWPDAQHEFPDRGPVIEIRQRFRQILKAVVVVDHGIDLSGLQHLHQAVGHGGEHFAVDIMIPEHAFGRGTFQKKTLPGQF